MIALTLTESVTLYDFSRLRTHYPYMMLIPQARFLEFLLAQAQQYPTFRVVMGARVEQLVAEDGRIRGVRYRGADGICEVHADLTIGADGRFSRVRNQAKLEAVKLATPIDLLWFKLPGEPGEANDRLYCLLQRKFSHLDGSIDR